MSEAALRDLEASVEALRAGLIVDRVVLQTVVDSLPAAQYWPLSAALKERLEVLTSRSLGSTMKEAFVEAQIATAQAWLETLARGGALREGRPGSQPR